MINKICGIFIFNSKKKLFLISPDDNKWSIPFGTHYDNKNYLEVAIRGIYSQTGISLGNYDEKYINYLKPTENVIPFLILGENSFDNVDCYANLSYDEEPPIEDWDWFSVKDAKSLLSKEQNTILQTIKL